MFLGEQLNFSNQIWCLVLAHNDLDVSVMICLSVLSNIYRDSRSNVGRYVLAPSVPVLRQEVQLGKQPGRYTMLS